MHEESAVQTYDDVSLRLITNLVDRYGAHAALKMYAKLAGYDQPPPTIDDFLSSDDYFKPMLPSAGFRRIWLNEFHDIFPTPYHSPYFEVIFTGPIGNGKTFTASVGLLYDMCRLLCLSDPQEYFGHSSSTKITFAVMNASQALAKDVLFDQLLAWIFESPFFKAHLNKKKKMTGNDTLFKNRVDLIMGSRSNQTTGRAIVSAILDEANFQTIVKDQAAKNYNSILRRIESRFMGKRGSLPCHFWLCSSKGNESDWLQQHIAAIENQQEKMPVKICDYPIWEFRKDEGIYDGTTFKVFIGDTIRDPFILDEGSDLYGIDEAHIIDVPSLYRGSFDKDIFGSLQEIAGRGTWSIKKFLPSNELIEEAMLRPNPMTRVKLQLDFFDEMDQIIRYLRYDQILPHSGARFLHFDLSTTECLTGIASVRFDEMTTVERYDVDTHRFIQIKEPIFHVDFLIAIQARPGQAIPLPKMKEFVLALRHRQYPIASISTDGYQSDYFRQELSMIGYDTQLISLDKTKEPYNHLKNTILESRLNCVSHPILTEELRELIDGDKKIDHRPGGSKDLSDALAGACWNAFTQRDKQHGFLYAPEQYLQAIEKFASGGYDGDSQDIFSLERLFISR